VKSIHLVLDLHSGIPIYLQIVEQIQKLAASGQLLPGDQLPTVRQLAAEIRVNFNTVARAYRMLDDAGLISTQQGRGTYLLEPGPENWSGRSRKPRSRQRSRKLLERWHARDMTGRISWTNYKRSSALNPSRNRWKIILEMRKNETQNQNIRFTSRRPEYVPIQCFDQTEGAKPRRSALERHCDICFHCHHADCGGYSHLHGYLEDPGHHHSPGGHPHHAHWFYFCLPSKWRGSGKRVWCCAWDVFTGSRDLASL